ncbi:Hypothetical protein A7982_08602 [Minicystis rosea]|nr:Hypothetical protein A7982_08602 [Minicystis rosea]
MPALKKKVPSPKKPDAPVKSELALNAVADEMAALDRSKLATINIDIPQAVAVALGVAPHLQALRAAIVAALPRHPIGFLDDLETYALAAYHAHIAWLPPEVVDDRVATLLAEAAPLRAMLLADAEALARRDWLDADAVAAIRAGQGHVDTANDLVALSALFLSRWPEIEHRTAATVDEVTRAGDLGPLVLAALGARVHGTPLSPTAAADQRRRAFTLFVRAYNETRRAVTYLRWNEGDADELAPSLYVGRRTARPTPKNEPTDGQGGVHAATG